MEIIHAAGADSSETPTFYDHPGIFGQLPIEAQVLTSWGVALLLAHGLIVAFGRNQASGLASGSTGRLEQGRHFWPQNCVGSPLKEIRRNLSHAPYPLGVPPCSGPGVNLSLLGRLQSPLSCEYLFKSMSISPS